MCRRAAGAAGVRGGLGTTWSSSLQQQIVTAPPVSELCKVCTHPLSPLPPEIGLAGLPHLQISSDSTSVLPPIVMAGTSPRGLTLLYHLGLLDKSTCTTSKGCRGSCASNRRSAGDVVRGEQQKGGVHTLSSIVNRTLCA